MLHTVINQGLLTYPWLLMLDEYPPVLFSSAFAPSGLQTVTAFEVVWKKGERREGGREKKGREGGGREV